MKANPTTQPEPTGDEPVEDTPTEPTPQPTAVDPMERRPLSAKQLGALMGNLNADRVMHRKQGSSGPQLSYLAAWDVKASLIRVFGFGNFSVDVLKTDLLHAEQYGPKSTWRVAMQAIVRLTIHQTGATYTEAAISGQSGNTFGDAAEFAVKTAESDALKRAAINLGTQFGLSLYDFGKTTDVVRVLLDPDQSETYESLRADGDVKVSAARDRIAEAVSLAPAPPDQRVGRATDEDPWGTLGGNQDPWQ